MKTLIFAFFAAALIGVTGCTTKSKARLQAQQSFVAGQQQAMNQAQQPKAIYFVGDVQNRMVAWTEESTLASALVEADFRGRRDPKAFVLHRNGQSYTVTAKQLLNGEDFSLTPGDTIEIVP